MKFNQKVLSLIDSLGGRERIWVGKHRDTWAVFDKWIETRFLIQLDNYHIVLHIDDGWGEYSHYGYVSDMPSWVLKNLYDALCDWEIFIQEKLASYHVELDAWKMSQLRTEAEKRINQIIANHVAYGDYDSALAIYAKHEGSGLLLDSIETIEKNLNGCYNSYISELNSWFVSELSCFNDVNQKIVGDGVNESYVLVLMWSIDRTKLVVDKVEIVDEELEAVEMGLIERASCFETTVEDFEVFFDSAPRLKKLNGMFRYCISLSDPYQGVTCNHNDIRHRLKVIDAKLKSLSIRSNSESHNGGRVNVREFRGQLMADLTELKIQILQVYSTWFKAYSINERYKNCAKNPRVIAYSHRISGWSNP